jgi:hypothetical protein
LSDVIVTVEIGGEERPSALAKDPETMVSMSIASSTVCTEITSCG